MTAGKLPCSLFSELCSIISSIIIGLIHTELNFQDELGRKSMMSEQSCYQIMLQTPTSWALTGDVPHLPIGNSPLDDWMNWFSNLGTTSDGHTNSITQEYNAIKNNQFAKIPHHEITQHLTKVKQFE